ncbi:hypothetical protein P168DRAFT_238753 [Aspergillus campestris IBT 28561]|uniref:Leucine-rich repeat protein n=1 Tax=Aspergillus campestris (strain IBT 28561) TaxID=1392248 RepID=A0A2I1D0G1_ASPC2|nr:uncharacterized protein P168DRAFT_238753 [Aspergillus campestris IBT 28561]PKY03363.1 hypothetical protein P168DRAFT_238753 [Aspergillus campestris IBT 28561]
MGNNPPWLESLSDDWVPLPATPGTPATPTSPATTRPLDHSRRSSLQSTPSRLPVPARRSVEPSSIDQKKVPRPCHFARKPAPPTPKYNSPRTPHKPRTPVPKVRTPRPDRSTPKYNPPASRKKPPPTDTKSPLRSVSNVSNMSNRSSQQGTVQVRPKKRDEKEGTPEWRKRLVKGDIPAGEQRDLFAPIGLESVFKPPTPGSDKTQQDPMAHMKNTGEAWDLDRIKPRITTQASTSPLGSPKRPTETTNASEGPSLDLEQSQDLSQNDTQRRTASGLEDLRNEDITPITFSRTNTVEGNGTSEVIRSALKQVTNKLERLSLAPWERPNSRASDSVLLNQQSDPAVETVPEDDLLDVTSHSLPQDLSVGTLDHRGRRAFASLRRDQYLGDTSFQRRRLSPPSFPTHLSPFLPENSRIRSSPPFYNKPNPMTDSLTLPRPSSAHVISTNFDQTGQDSTDAMPSSGSPLKLFGDHDTFTNNKLLRRMSQFEETFGGLSEDDEPVSPSEEARRKGENRSLLGRHDDPFSENSTRRYERPRSRHTPNSRLHKFGDGQLDHFGFPDTNPNEPQLLSHEPSDANSRPSSRRQKYLRRTSYRTSSREQTSDASNSKYLVRSNLSSAASTQRDKMDGGRDADKENQDPSEKDATPPSPAKDPHPKRRRTILMSDDSIQDDYEAWTAPGQAPDNMSLLQRSLMQHGVSYDEDSTRPRSPTPNQTASFDAGNDSFSQIDGDSNFFDGEQSPNRDVPIVRVTGVNDEIRKGSITTQDFLNEATKIMDIIRSNGHKGNGLSSVEESTAEDGKSNDSYDDDSTREDFSRPPSREGVDIRKLREPRTQNARVLSHLRKFQEKDDQEFGRRGSIPGPRKRKLSTQNSFGEDDDLPDLLTLNTQLSKAFSARSIPTSSSHSSQAKGVLSSDLVSHLIPEQVNGMTYDRLKHQWVRQRPRRVAPVPKEDNSEDDPFSDIPDLSVDEMQEILRIERYFSDRPDTADSARYSGAQGSLRSESHSTKSDPRPESKDGEPSVTASSVQSKGTQFTSSVPHTGTGATSWGTEARKSRDSSNEAKHEMQLHEGQPSMPPGPQKDANQKARVVTISFSSPLVSQVAYSDDESPAKLRREQNSTGSQTEHQDTEGETSRLDARQTTTLTGRRNSVHEEPFLRRSISRIDERDEDAAENMSLVRRNSMPAETFLSEHYNENSMLVRNTGHDTTYSFHMSPLPDFTVDQVDQSLDPEMSYVAQRAHPKSLRQVHGTFAMATEEIVKHITEAEPFEPYWEHVRRLVLRRKGLITLHKLADFCPRLEDLDVSYNDIGQLGGVPSSLRTLKMQNNCLSNLTSWSHLSNLQYLDVSGNDLESLDGLSGLIHLREVNASNNDIRDISGAFELNGLLSLKLSNNSLTMVDFAGSELTRLEELDLSHNDLLSVQNLGTLSALSSLDLSSNQLSKAEFSNVLLNMRSLRVSNNQLPSLDVGVIPSLTLLYADQNRLSTISGLGRCHSLEILSAREQTLSNEHNGGFFDVDLGLVKDVRKVFLSSNHLSMQTLSPSVPLSSLQLLDIASCNIQTLPLDFALNFPNLKVLNLNFNSLASVAELVGLNCLARLTVAGNCIARLRKFCQVLSRLGRMNKSKVSSLQKVDIRGNPLTVRFYPPAITGSGRDNRPDARKLKAKEEESHPPTSPARKTGLDLPSVLADFSHCHELSRIIGNDDDEDDNDEADGPEIDDPYTLPLADALADQKYVSRLDESTRLRRRVFELMLYAGTGGSLKFLDGLEMRPTLEEGSDMDRAWSRLEKLGVLKKKAITA